LNNYGFTGDGIFTFLYKLQNGNEAGFFYHMVISGAFRGEEKRHKAIK